MTSMSKIHPSLLLAQGFGFVSLIFCVVFVSVGTNASDYLKSLISKMPCYVSGGT